MSIEADDVRRFLQHFDANWRGHLTNEFLGPVRHGVRDLKRICSAVFAEARRKAAGQYTNATSRERYLSLLRWLVEDQEGALDFARSCIEYESLSPDEKTRRKEAHAAEGKRQWMERQPASERQLAYLRSLGCSQPANSMAEASDLIEKWKDRR